MTTPQNPAPTATDPVGGCVQDVSPAASVVKVRGSPESANRVGQDDTRDGAASAMFTLCEACDGRGHDDDLLCPMPCDACNGTGLEEWADEPLWGDE